MGTLTIYVASADLTTLSAIFNGVAMICTQTTMIWGFALLASTWRIVSTVTSATIETSSGKAGSVLTRGSYSAIMPLIFAMLLTFPGFQSKVQVESTLNGNVTTIANVPVIIAAIPAAGSLMSTQVGAVVTTAFQSVGTDYPALSAGANGFINPLKVLLSSRTAILRLGSIDSQVKTLVAACLASDAGVDYSAINASVINAGNTGATAVQTLPINGISGTSMGALLYYASLNTTGLVSNLASSGASVLSCPDAANLVADNITTSLQSAEFARVVQGAVNGMDQPIATANYGFDQLNTQYTALATANTVTNTLSGGANQASAELINLLFAELVNNDLNCLAADGADKASCEATMIQATEVERNNIQAAANEVPMLKYAGSFGNYILALIIGLGPVIVMFMMFSGVDSGKCVKTAVHIMVWPLLVTNVGAELVNGMLCLQLANFMTSIRQGGFISQAETLAIYKEFSLQVGTGSHIMASLPVLMSMIFALGESSALVSVANTLTPKGTEAGTVNAMSPIGATPMVSQSSMATAEQGVGFSKVHMRGGMEAVNASGQFANLTKAVNQNISESDTRQQTLSQGSNNLSDVKEAFSTQDYSKLGWDKRTGESIRKNFEAATRTNERVSEGEGSQGARQNVNSTSAGVNGGLGFSTGGGLKASIGASADTKTAAVDSQQGTKYSATDRALDESKALTKAISEEMSKAHSSSGGRDKTHSLGKTLDTQTSYQNLLSDSKSRTDTTAQTLNDSAQFVGSLQNIGSDHMAMQMRTNRDFAFYQTNEGRKFDANPATKPYREEVAQEMSNGGVDRLLNNPEGHDAAVRVMAATRMSQDANASPEDRFAALKFAAGSAKAMLHMGFDPENTTLKNDTFGAPQDDTGVNTVDLQHRGNGVAPHAAVPRGTHSTTAARKHSASSTSTGNGSASDPFRTEQAELSTGIAASGGNIRKERARQEQVNADSGLDAKGHDTIIRTATNVADNAASVFRKSGGSDRTHIGKPDTGAVAASNERNSPPSPRPDAAGDGGD